MNKEQLIEEIKELNNQLRSKLRALADLEIDPKTIEEAYTDHIVYGSVDET